MSGLAYRGRLAPSPTGFLHLGHGRTFWIAQARAAAHNGTLILRNDDLDGARCRAPFVDAMLEDLRWVGLSWSEGPDCGGPFAPYNQSQRLPHYQAAFARLRRANAIYPCTCSRQEVLRALSAPHPEDDEPLYSGKCRPADSPGTSGTDLDSAGLAALPAAPVNWRFRVPYGQSISFLDQALGQCAQVAGRDFGDFLVWRKDGAPSYQLACVVDDAAMGITEVVRGEDLIPSTFRQILLYEALGIARPEFYHCPLLNDSEGKRLAKRHDAASLRAQRAQGISPAALQRGWGCRSA